MVMITKELDIIAKLTLIGAHACNFCGLGAVVFGADNFTLGLYIACSVFLWLHILSINGIN